MNSPIQAIDLTRISQTFPESVEGVIERPHFLDIVDTMFASGIRCVVLEGKSGIGKTTLAAQFARRHGARTISLFVRVQSRWGHDLDLMKQELCSQMSWFTSGADGEAHVPPTDATFRNLIYQVRKTSRLRGSDVLFVVDGLGDLPSSKMGIEQALLDLLPLDYERARFLFTDGSRGAPKLPVGISVRSYPLAPFSPEETRRFFGEILPQGKVDEIHRICGGCPGDLASVRRAAASGQSIDNLLDPGNPIGSIFENEWLQVDRNDSDQLLLCALLAHDDGDHRLSDLVRILSWDEERVNNCVKRFTFLRTSSQDGDITFTTDSFRTFVAGRLRDLVPSIRELVIDDLLRTSEQGRRTMLLPQKLQEAGRYSELLEFLSPQHVVELLQRGGSIVPIRRQMDLGFEAASKLERDADLIRLAMQIAALADRYPLDICKSEIRAWIALGNAGNALSVANGASVKEDRLALLAAMARANRVYQKAVDQELVDNIKSLCESTDPAALENILDEVASDLVFVAPELALNLMDRARDAKATAKPPSTFGTLSVDTKPATVDESPEEENERKRESRNAVLDRFNAAVSLHMGGLTASGFLREVAKFKDGKAQLFFMRRWALRNAKRTDADEVVHAALELTVRETLYTPNARDMRQIATPLPFIDNPEKQASLVATLDAQQAIIKKNGPSVDYFRLQLTLAEAVAGRDGAAAHQRLVETLAYLTTEVLDTSVRAECFAHLVSTLLRLSRKYETPELKTLLTDAETQLVQLSQAVAGSTADHLAVLVGVVEAIAIEDIARAEQIIKMVNTEPRRDRARQRALVAALSPSTDAVDLDGIRRVLDAIQSVDIRSDAIRDLWRILDSFGQELALDRQRCKALVQDIDDIADPFYRCEAFSSAYLYFVGHDPIAVSILRNIERSWEAIDPIWERVESAFWLAAELATRERDVAEAYLRKGQHEKDEMLLNSPGCSGDYVASLGLAVHAFSGLLHRRIDNKDDLDSVGSLIEAIPSHAKRGQIWADVAERFYLAGRIEECQSVVTARVRPILEKFLGDKASSRAELVVSIAPALYLASIAMFEDAVGALDPNARVEAISATCLFILSRCPSADPATYAIDHEFSLTYKDACEILRLLRGADSDSMIYGYLKRLADAVLAKRNASSISFEQRNDIARKIEDLAKEKFPSPRFIAHEGYRILAEAQVARISRAQQHVWDTLIARARAIPNAADRAFVICHMLELMPTKEQQRNRALLLECEQTLDQIPSLYDRLSRRQSAGEALWHVDRKVARELLRTALKVEEGADERAFSGIQREVVDFVHRVDPEYAAKLVAELDNDPARLASRKRLATRLRILEAEKRMMDVKQTAPSPEQQEHQQQAAWGSLQRLNSGAATPLPLSKLRPYMRVPGGNSVSDAFPIFCWVVANAVKRYRETNEALTIIRPLFEATVTACQVAARMVTRVSREKAGQTVLKIPTLATDDALLVRNGQRQDAIAFIKRWLTDNAQEYLKICDPFFGPDDLELLRMVLEVRPDLRVLILTSLKHHRGDGIASPYEDSYRDRWTRISAQSPPDTEVTIAGRAGDDALPIHDRWMISKHGSAIELGTSYKSLGVGRDSKISIMPKLVALDTEQNVDRYLLRHEREYDGKKITYAMFTL